MNLIYGGIPAQEVDLPKCVMIGKRPIIKLNLLIHQQKQWGQVLQIIMNQHTGHFLNLQWQIIVCRMLFDTDIVIRGLSSNIVEYTIYETKSTGRNTAPEPSIKATGTLSTNNGTVTIHATNCLMSSAFKLSITELNNNNTTTTPTGTICGDVNSSGNVDITDALLIAQYYVGGNQSNFAQGAADVNDDGIINIQDALLVAQYYVGIIDTLSCNQ